MAEFEGIIGRNFQPLMWAVKYIYIFSHFFRDILKQKLEEI